MLTTNPIVRATLQATTLSMISNIIGQAVRAYQKDQPLTFNLIELLRFATMTLITSPPNYKWQQLLERTFPAYQGSTNHESLPTTEQEATKRKDYERHKRRDSNAKEKGGEGEDHGATWSPKRQRKLNIQNTFFKWFIDCITLGTLVNTAAFVVIMAILKGYSMPQVKQSVQTETMPIILAGYRVWPIVSVISFSFVPVERRIVFLSSVGLLWGVYMSLVAARV